MPKDVITRTTSLAELGVQAIPDVTATLNAELIIKRKALQGETVYLAAPKRLKAGTMLAYLVNSISKQTYDLGNSAGIVDDLRLQEEAKLKYASDATKQRDQRHRNSFFGPIYKEIDGSHRAPWIQALSHESAPGRELTNFLASLHTRHIDYVIDDAKAAAQSWDKSKTDDDWLTMIRSDGFKSIGRERHHELNALVASQLTPEEVKLYIIDTKLVQQTVVDFNRSLVYPKPHFEIDEIIITPPNRVNFTSENYGYALNAQFSADINGGDLRWSMDDYSIVLKREDDQKRFDSEALLPLIAWTRDQEGHRKYLTQTRFRSMQWPSLPANSDVLLGRVLAAYLTPGIPDIWQEKMPLRKGGEKNNIMGAQALVLASLPHPNFGGKVLRDQSGVLAKIEAGFD